MKFKKNFIFIITLLLAFVLHFKGRAQFYNGSAPVTFGKNRIQSEDYFWEYRKYDSYKIYFYEGGESLALFAADVVDETIKELTNRVDYYLEDDERINIMIYNKIEDFRKSNMGLSEDHNNIGGVTRIYGRNVFIYFDGNHYHFERNIREGISRVIAQQMVYGDSWMEVVKNSALLTMPDWYLEGLVSYLSTPFDDVENRIKDGIQNKRYYKFNRLEKEESVYFGHALWSYIAEMYGEKLIPNVLYMSRVSRSIESGFLYVLGVSFKSLKKDMLLHYENQYALEPSNLELDNEAIQVLKTKKNKIYSQAKINNEGTMAAYVENRLGKVKVFIVDLEKGKRKKVFKWGYKLDRINSTDYPLLGWHPIENMLSIIYEDHDQLTLMYYFVDEKRVEEKPIFKLEKVTSFDYSRDGKTMIVSGIAQGQSDLFLYKVGPNTLQKLTDDIYDDMDPVFIDEDKILFSSNRIDDTLRTNKQILNPNDLALSFDLFSYSLSKETMPLRKVTSSDIHNETNPEVYDSERFTFISDKTGSNERYIAKQDSVISSIDTSIHYRYFITSSPLTQYKKDISSYSYALEANKGIDVVFDENRYNVFVFPKIDSLKTEEKSSGNEENPDPNPDIAPIKPTKKVEYIVYPEPSKKDPEDANIIDIKNYTFYREKDNVASSKPSKNEIGGSLPSNTPDSTKLNIKEKLIPSARRYKVNFVASDITSQFDFNFANQIYQFFNGGPYIPPGMGVVFKVDMIDLFEDYKAEGGLRYSLNGGSTEYFASLEDRSKRWDKKYSFQRQTTLFDGDFFSAKTITNVLKVRYSYPFSEVESIRLTPILRRDQGIILSTDQATAGAEDAFDNWVGVNIEYIFDNSLFKDLNLYTGWKLKVFGEHYRIIDEAETDFSVVGVDMRYGQKIHRNLIWFNRFSGGTSFGARKLVHYLGAVDNWTRLGGNPYFNFDTPISFEQGYYYQTIVPPLRGFIQNVRNGNSFALINSELRFPILKYFIAKPLKSEFLANFQVTGFADVGTAWTGLHPYSDENVFNTKTVTDGNVTVLVKNQIDPIAAGVGWGLRSKLFGYFLKFDYAWGIEDGVFKKPLTYLSIGTDF